MKRKFTYSTFLILGLLMGAGQLFAQNITDLRINEVMLINTENYTDNFGQRSPWIEIMNLGYNSVNISTCYLTNDLNNPKKYRIPSGDPISLIPMRQFLVFFADSIAEHGTLHLNFTLDSTQRFVALVAPDGTFIDSITVPQLAPNQVFHRTPDGGAEWEISNYTTPNATNEGRIEKVSAGDRFIKFDPYGFILAIIAMGTVFSALIVLYRIFRTIGKANQRAAQRRATRLTQGTTQSADRQEVAGEVFAAISTALYMYETDKHDQEATIITIQRVSRLYSPWSSKIYGLRQMPPRTVSRQTK